MVQLNRTHLEALADEARTILPPRIILKGETRPVHLLTVRWHRDFPIPHDPKVAVAIKKAFRIFETREVPASAIRLA